MSFFKPTLHYVIWPVFILFFKAMMNNITLMIRNKLFIDNSFCRIIQMPCLYFFLDREQVWSTTFFSTFNTDRQTDQHAYFPIEMQFYISVMFLGFPDEIHKEKPSISDFENNWLRTDGPTDRRTDGRTDPLIEMRGRI